MARGEPLAIGRDWRNADACRLSDRLECCTGRARLLGAAQTCVTHPVNQRRTLASGSRQNCLLMFKYSEPVTCTFGPFWGASDLEQKLLQFRDYYNHASYCPILLCR